jgi:hypothetical protein
MVAITAKQYAALRGVVNGAVRKAIKLGHAMPGVVKLEKFGNAHRIYVSNGFFEENKKKLKKSFEVTK